MKIDFKKTLDSYKAKHNEFSVIEVPKMKYLMIDGRGDPNTTKEFNLAIKTLYPVAYKLKFMSKLDIGKDYVVGPLEGLWWAEDMGKFTSLRDKSAWEWTLMFMVPDWITEDMYKLALEKIKEKNLPMISKLRLESLNEGKCVQVMHIGSFDDETEILHELHSEFIPQNGFKMVKKHHEIYLSDFRKVSPNKLKTILRQPVEKI